MDKSMPAGMSSDLVPEQYCEQSNQTDETANSIAGYFIDSHRDFCFDCYSSHQRSIFQDDHLLNQETKQKKEQQLQFEHDNSDESENQLKSLEHNLDKLLKDLNVRRNLNLKKSPNASVPKSKVFSIAAQKRKKPNYIQDLELKFNHNFSRTLVLPNKQMLLTDFSNRRLMLIDTTKGAMVTEIETTGTPLAITKTKKDEIVVMTIFPDRIMFFSVTKYFLLKGREISLTGMCRAIAYNDKDKTFIVTFIYPAKVEILNLHGQVLKKVYKDSKGDAQPNCVGISPDMTTAYIGDYRSKGTVTCMTMEGEIKAIYKNKHLQSPSDIYVHKSGLVYIVGYYSHTLHQLDPDNGQFKLLLERKHRLEYPVSISYCDLENKMYIVNRQNNVLKVFKMK